MAAWRTHELYTDITVDIPLYVSIVEPNDMIHNTGEILDEEPET